MIKRMKQCVGIDVSQKELEICLGFLGDDLKIEILKRRTFRNTPKGIEALVEWLGKHVDTDVKTVVVMEATGVYHEGCAYALYANNFKVSIELPNKISNYLRSLNQKTKTDKKDAQAICQFGLERNLNSWSPPKEIYRTLCGVTRERAQIALEISMQKNKLHAERARHFSSEKLIERLLIRIKLNEDQIKEIEAELKTIVNSDAELKKNITRTESIVGIGFLTATIIYAETEGFALIENKKQLSSYAGFDIRQRQSGTSINGKTKISKHGNKHLRAAMHYPALSAVQHVDYYKTTCARIISRSGIKMKGYVAIQRQLLELVFILHKNQETFDREYHNKKAEEINLDRSQADIKNTALSLQN